MSYRYQLNPYALGFGLEEVDGVFEEPPRSVLLVNYSPSDLRLMAYAIQFSVPWIQQITFGPPSPQEVPTLFALNASEVTGDLVADRTTLVFEGSEPPPTATLLSGTWVRPSDVLVQSDPQLLLTLTDWQVIRELERMMLPEDHPLRAEREALRGQVPPPVTSP